MRFDNSELRTPNSELRLLDLALDEDGFNAAVIVHDAVNGSLFAQQIDEGLFNIDLALLARVVLLGDDDVELTLGVDQADGLAVHDALLSAVNVGGPPFAQLGIATGVYDLT